MAEAGVVYEQINSYAFCAFPFDHPSARHYTVTVDRCDDGMWAIRHVGYYLAPDGTWSPNFQPLRNLPEALEAAQDAAPLLWLARGKARAEDGRG